MQIRFTFQTQYGEFSDALNLPDDHQFTEVEIEAMKQARLTNWLAIISPALPEETLPLTQEV